MFEPDGNDSDGSDGSTGVVTGGIYRHDKDDRIIREIVDPRRGGALVRLTHVVDAPKDMAQEGVTFAQGDDGGLYGIHTVPLNASSPQDLTTRVFDTKDGREMTPMSIELESTLNTGDTEGRVVHTPMEGIDDFEETPRPQMESVHSSRKFGYEPRLLPRPNCSAEETSADPFYTGYFPSGRGVRAVLLNIARQGYVMWTSTERLGELINLFTQDHAAMKANIGAAKDKLDALRSVAPFHTLPDGGRRPYSEQENMELNEAQSRAKNEHDSLEKNLSRRTIQWGPSMTGINLAHILRHMYGNEGGAYVAFDFMPAEEYPPPDSRQKLLDDHLYALGHAFENYKTQHPFLDQAGLEAALSERKDELGRIIMNAPTEGIQGWEELWTFWKQLRESLGLCGAEQLPCAQPPPQFPPIDVLSSEELTRELEIRGGKHHSTVHSAIRRTMRDGSKPAHGDRRLLQEAYAVEQGMPSYVDISTLVPLLPFSTIEGDSEEYKDIAGVYVLEDADVPTWLNKDIIPANDDIAAALKELDVARPSIRSVIGAARHHLGMKYPAHTIDEAVRIYIIKAAAAALGSAPDIHKRSIDSKQTYLSWARVPKEYWDSAIKAQEWSGSVKGLWKIATIGSDNCALPQVMRLIHSYQHDNGIDATPVVLNLTCQGDRIQKPYAFADKRSSARSTEDKEKIVPGNKKFSFSEMATAKCMDALRSGDDILAFNSESMDVRTRVVLQQGVNVEVLPPKTQIFAIIGHGFSPHQENVWTRNTETPFPIAMDAFGVKTSGLPRLTPIPVSGVANNRGVPLDWKAYERGEAQVWSNPASHAGPWRRLSPDAAVVGGAGASRRDTGLVDSYNHDMMLLATNPSRLADATREFITKYGTHPNPPTEFTEWVEAQIANETTGFNTADDIEEKRSPRRRKSSRRTKRIHVGSAKDNAVAALLCSLHDRSQHRKCVKKYSQPRSSRKKTKIKSRRRIRIKSRRRIRIKSRRRSRNKSRRRSRIKSRRRSSNKSRRRSINKSRRRSRNKSRRRSRNKSRRRSRNKSRRRSRNKSRRSER